MPPNGLLPGDATQWTAEPARWVAPKDAAALEDVRVDSVWRWVRAGLVLARRLGPRPRKGPDRRRVRVALDARGLVVFLARFA